MISYEIVVSHFDMWRQGDDFELHPHSAEGLAQCGLKAHRVCFQHRCRMSESDVQQVLQALQGQEAPQDALKEALKELKELKESSEIHLEHLSCRLKRLAGETEVVVQWDRKAEEEPQQRGFLRALGVALEKEEKEGSEEIE